MNASAFPRSIRARIDESTLDRVPRMFSASIEDVIAETLQNARRAGATRVDIKVDRPIPTAEQSHRITICDDGAGIADPGVLLSYGQNGWSRDLVEREDAAGMGFLSLARIGCTVASRPQSLNGRAHDGWRVQLETEHFTGKAPAAVSRCEEAPWPHGTSIAFLIVTHVMDIRNAIANACLYYPLPVTLSGLPESPPAGDPLPRKRFLQDAIHEESWQGIRIGVLTHGRRPYREPTINFHGHTIETGLPQTSSIDGPDWTVRADIENCPELELVLPARKQIVATPFVPRMEEACKHAIYRAMAAHPDPRPNYGTWAAARDAGIAIPPAPPLLRPWRPANADWCSNREQPAREPFSADPLIVDFDETPPLAQAFWRAAQRAGIHDRLYCRDTDLAGYGWYDALPRITAVDIEIIAGSLAWSLDDFPTDDTGSGSRPDAITAHLDLKHADGTRSALVIDADLAFSGNEDCYVDEIAPLVTASSDLKPHELAHLIHEAYFCYSDDAESNSWETQREDFQLTANRIATGLLSTEDEATIDAIRHEAVRHLLWLAPHDRSVTISIERSTVRVSLADHEPKEAA